MIGKLVSDVLACSCSFPYFRSLKNVFFLLHIRLSSRQPGSMRYPGLLGEHHG